MIRAVIFDYGQVLRRQLRLQHSLFEFAKELREEGYETAVLSNMYSPLTWILKKMGDLKEFKPVVFSSDIGVRKPKPAAYEAIVKQLDITPGECLFVDNRQENLDGAQRIGMRVVLAQDTDTTIANIKKHLNKV